MLNLFLQKEKGMLTEQKRIIIRKIINANFTFSDLSPRFIGVDSSTGNIFCPFHENHTSPAAKMYWDEYRELWVIYCFGECHRHFTAYDYVNLVLCKKYEKYKDPMDFLKKNMSISVLKNQIKLYKKDTSELDESQYQKKVTYINNVFSDCDENIADYIEELYTKGIN